MYSSPSYTLSRCDVLIGRLEPVTNQSNEPDPRDKTTNALSVTCALDGYFRQKRISSYVLYHLCWIVFYVDFLKIAKHHKSVHIAPLSPHLVEITKERHPVPSSKSRDGKTTNLGNNSNYNFDPALTSAILSYRNLNVYVVGAVGHPKAKIIRVVHISDTRGNHDAFAKNIPRGHILIHSGDFNSHPPSRRFRISSLYHRITRPRRSPPKQTNWREEVEELERFFSQQPHDYKIFIPGCWEDWCSSSGPDKPTPEKIQSILRSAIYLQDSWCRVLGLTIYGTPWTAADDLRPEDGAPSSHYLRRLFCPKLVKHSTERISEVAPETAQLYNHELSRPLVYTNDKSRGFILPDIKLIAAKWARIPTDSDIVVTHMPAWRSELFFHIAQRIKPILHLCGHDFAGYGVIWDRGTVFSNAALQLTPSFPAAPNPTRSSNYPRTVATTSSLAETAEHLSPNNYVQPLVVDPHFREPQLYIPKPKGRQRPPRWQRRLPPSLSRLFGGGGRWCMQSCAGRSLHTKTNVVVSETQSTKAASEHVCADAGFVYDPDMRAGIGAMALADSGGSGRSGAPYSGGSTGLTGSTMCSSMYRRNPIVIDVYVVDEGKSTVLPQYYDRLNPTCSTTSDDTANLL